MTPPPKPATDDGTEIDAVANGPSGAVTVASVGSGPLRYSVSAPAGAETPSRVTVVASKRGGQGAQERAGMGSIAWCSPSGGSRGERPPRS